MSIMVGLERIAARSRHNRRDTAHRADPESNPVQPPSANFGEATGPPRTDKLAALGFGSLAPTYGPGGGTSPSQDQAMGMSDDMSLQGELAERANGSVLKQQKDLGPETVAPPAEPTPPPPQRTCSPRLGSIPETAWKGRGDGRCMGPSPSAVIAPRPGRGKNGAAPGPPSRPSRGRSR